MNARQRHVIRAAKGLESGAAGIVPIHNQDAAPIGHLQPINLDLANDEATIGMLTAWRTRSMEYFLTQFTATPERTRAWLNNAVLAHDDRILFLICDHNGRAVGNFGVANIVAESAELDNLIRGEIGGAPRLIYFAELALMDWTYRTLGVERIHLRVFSANRRTIALHESVGFRITESVRLVREDRDGEIHYRPDPANPPAADDMMLYTMAIDKQDFQTAYKWLQATSHPAT